MKKYYIMFTSTISFIGVLGILLVRPILLQNLGQNLNKHQYFNEDFILWAIGKFDSFAKMSIIANLLIIATLLSLLFVFRKNKNSFIIRYFSIFVALVMVANFAASIVYSFQTMNKFFDLAAYLGELSISWIFILFILFAVKRFVLKD